MSALTELSRRVVRRHGHTVVAIDEAGLELRGHRREKGLRISWPELAKVLLEHHGYSLTSVEWREPLETLHRLAGLEAGGHRFRSRQRRTTR